ncbi:MAG: DUF4845 domain-containing protein [Zetaproteobacteria bacterium]|nr:MAG: DUF4845 domain-containing protein [Zetaproteobacteria bacterium]
MSERGFSKSKFLLIASAILIPLWYAWLLVPVYMTKWKAQQVFESVASTMANASEEEIRRRLPQLLDAQYIDPDDLPQAFYSNLEIQADGTRVSISTIYDVTIWPLGPVGNVRDWQGNYVIGELDQLDRWRDALRIDLEFSLHAETP